MANQTNRPRGVRVVLLALLGVLVSAVCKAIYVELLAAFPGKDLIVKVVVVVLFSVLMSYLCIKPIMNEFGQNWKN